MTKKVKQIVCRWALTNGEEPWEGDCGIEWTCPDGTPRDNGMRYCPRCGRRLKQQRGASR